MEDRTRHVAIMSLGAALLIPAQCAPRATVEAGPLGRVVECSVSMGVPASFVVEDCGARDGLRRVEGGSVLLALPSDWDRRQPLEVRLTWAVRDDFPIGEAAAPVLYARGALVGAGDHHHPQWLHPDELDLDQEPVLEVARPNYGLEQGDLVGHPYRGASSTLAMATVIVEAAMVEPQDEFLALYLDPEWGRWPLPGAVDGELLPQARLRYALR
jgi:hypothetical protein